MTKISIYNFMYKLLSLEIQLSDIFKGTVGGVRKMRVIGGAQEDSAR
jgi:hypothetical protein